RAAIDEIEARLPTLAVVCRLFAKLPHRPVRLFRIGHPDERRAPLARDHHSRAVPAAGEQHSRAGAVDPELLPTLRRRYVNTEAATPRLVERHPVFANAATIDRFDQAARDQLALGIVHVPAARPEVELV